MLQRSTWSGLLLSTAVLSAIWLTSPAQLYAQEEPAPAPAAAAAPASPADAAKLKGLADDYLHYSLVNNAEMAKSSAQAILAANPDPKDLLAAFEEAANGRDPREIMLRNQRRDELKEVSKQLFDKLEEGARAVARDPVRIRADIERLGNGPRAYNNARDHLVAAGQFAAPIYFEYLQNAQKKDVQPFIMRVIVEAGRPMVLPLVEELQVSDPLLRITLVNLLGQIGYRQALPSLRAIQADEKTDTETRAAIDSAITMIDKSGAALKVSPTALYLEAADCYYDKKPSYQPILQDEKTNPVWTFDKGLNNVVSVAVPTSIWNCVMAAKNSKAALEIDNNNAKAISLWITAELKKDILLQGAADPMASGKDASFIALASGPLYVNAVLTRALDTRDSALALRAIDALEATGGTNGLVSATEGAPLVRALSYADRAVRFRAAFALARANPTSAFPSFFRVVPILAEAVNSTGTPTALVIESNEDVRNKLSDVLRTGSVHYNVYSGGTLATALEPAQRAAAFDVVLVANGAEITRIADVGRTDYRLSGAPVLVTAPAASLAAVKVQLADKKGYAPVDEVADDAAITAALAVARADSGNGPLDPEKATQFSATAIKLLTSLAADHKSIYRVVDAQVTLTEALRDKRPEIATGAAGVLGQLDNNPEAQKSLAGAALSPDTDGAVRAPMFVALAESAKRTPNSLDAATITSLIKVVSTESDPAVRNAAATALGALNIPSNQAAPLILQQGK